MVKEANNPMNPEEMAKASQDAIKAAMEQAQALYGNIPGFQAFDLAKMQEKLMADAVANIPGMEGKVQQPEIEDTSAMTPEEVREEPPEFLNGHAFTLFQNQAMHEIPRKTGFFLERRGRKDLFPLIEAVDVGNKARISQAPAGHHHVRGPR